MPESQYKAIEDFVAWFIETRNLSTDNAMTLASAALEFTGGDDV